MGYNGHIYQKGEYVDVISSAEVERLSGYNVIDIEALPVKVEPDIEPMKVEKAPGSSVAKTKKRSKTK